MRLKSDGYPLPVSKKLCAILSHEIQKADVSTESGVIVHFRDPGYSAERGGFHPVEVYVGEDGRIRYVTEFTWVGLEPMLDLVKSCDFDFSEGVYQDLRGVHPIDSADRRSFWRLWQGNFVEYHRMGVYAVTVEKGP